MSIKLGILLFDIVFFIFKLKIKIHVQFWQNNTRRRITIKHTSLMANIKSSIDIHHSKNLKKGGISITIQLMANINYCRDQEKKQKKIFWLCPRISHMLRFFFLRINAEYTISQYTLGVEHY